MKKQKQTYFTPDINAPILSVNKYESDFCFADFINNPLLTEIQKLKLAAIAKVVPQCKLNTEAYFRHFDKQSFDEVAAYIYSQNWTEYITNGRGTLPNTQVFFEINKFEDVITLRNLHKDPYLETDRFLVVDQNGHTNFIENAKKYNPEYNKYLLTTNIHEFKFNEDKINYTFHSKSAFTPTMGIIKSDAKTFNIEDTLPEEQ